MDEDLIKRRFGTLVRRAREAKAIPQERLAEMIGMGRTSVTNIELGRQNVNLQTVYKIAQALEVDPRNLLPLEGATPEIPTPEEIAAASNSLRTLVQRYLEQVKPKTQPGGPDG